MDSKKSDKRPGVHGGKTHGQTPAFSQTFDHSKQKKNPEHMCTRSQYYQSVQTSTATHAQTVTDTAWGGAIPKHTLSTYPSDSSAKDLSKTWHKSSTVARTKETDSTLELMQPVNNKSHVEVLARKFIDQIVDEYTSVVVNKIDAECESYLVNELNKWPGLYAEIIDRTLYVACLSSQEPEITKKLSDFMKGIQHYTRNGHEVIKVPYKVLEFESSIKKKFGVKFPDVNIEMQDKSDYAVCVLCGSDTVVGKAASVINDIVKQMLSRPVELLPNVAQLLHCRNFLDKVKNKFSHNFPNCVVSVENGLIHVTGYDETDVVRAASFVTDLVKTEKIDVPETLSDTSMKCHLQKKFGDSVAMEINSFGQIQVSGLCEDVDRVLNESVDIEEGRVSLEKSLVHSVVSTEYPSTYSCRHSIEDVRVAGFIKTTNYLEKISQHFHCTVSLFPGSYNFVVVVKGNEKAVSEAWNEIETLLKDIRHTKLDIIDPKAQKYIESASSSLEKEHNVHIKEHHHDVLTNGKLSICKEHHGNSILWNTSQRERQLVISSYDKQTDCEGYQMQFLESNPNTGKRLSRNDKTLIVHVPSWTDGNQAALNGFADIISKALEKMSSRKMEKLFIPVRAVSGWELSCFLKCIISECIKWLIQLSKSYPCQVTLYALTDESEEMAESLVDTYCLHYMNPSIDDRPVVKVVVGQLDKTEADILVNTAAQDLDLSKGTVSKALSKAAGSDLQRECQTNHPDGIQPGEVTCTKGYNLRCKYVFHVTIPLFSVDTPNLLVNLQNIRVPMISCLKMASEHNFKTIAFPAIGSGKLGYPMDIVASEMFNSVKRFKQNCPKTSLQEVVFVIYKKDTELVTIFRDLEKKFDQKVEASWKHCTCLEITGLPENVKSAKHSIKEKMRIASNPKAELTEFIDDISTSECTVLYQMFYQEMSKMGKNITYDKQQQGFTIKGPPGIVGPYLVKVKKFIKAVKEMEHYKLPVDCSHELLSEIKTKFIGEVFVVYDADECLMEMFAKKKDTLDAAVKQIEILKQLHGNDTRTAKVEQPKEKMKDEVRRKLPERSFSWSKDASNMMVFETKCLIVKVYNADILSVPVDVIVNAANNTLDHCGGVAHKIAKGAGEDLVEESRQIIEEHKELPVSSVVKTTAGRLSYKYILHAVGPCWSDYEPINFKSLRKCEDDLMTTITNCFMMANEIQVTAMALPTISSGLFRVPHEICAEQYARAILNYTKSGPLEEVHFVNNDSKSDILPITHKVFSEMIVNKRQSPFPKDRYLPLPSAKQPDADAYAVNDKQNRKNTCRDKPTSGTDNKPVLSLDRFVASDVFINVSYEMKDEKLIFGADGACPLFVYLGDIFCIDGIEAVVCSDNKNGEGKGMIAKRLHELGGKRFSEAKAEEFKTPRRVSDVVTTCSGANIKYKFVLTVVISRNSSGRLDSAYRNVLEDARRQNIQSIVLPLLGTGICDFSAEDSVKILWFEWIQFCQRYRNYSSLLEVHLVLHDKDVFIEVQKLLTMFICDIEKHSKSLTSGDTEMEESSTPHDERKKFNDQNDDNDDHDEDSKTEHAMSMGQEEENCVICMDNIDNPKKLKCGHSFCTDCIDGYFKVKQMCPTCGQVCGVIFGDQPDGVLMIRKRKTSLAGYEKYGCFALTYNFPASSQGPNHPQPGMPYKAVRRTGYLPDTTRGRKICAMMKVAFDRRLVFTIGTSRTTGEQGVITWNDIHHKTDTKPNTQFGYPDSTYLERVEDELAVKGVTPDDIDRGFLKDLKAEEFKGTFSATKM